MIFCVEVDSMMYDVFSPVTLDSLKEIDHQPPLPQKDSDDLYSPGKILGNYFYITDKPGGVEPGHLVIKIDQEFAAMANVLAIEIFRKLAPNSSNYELPKNSRDVKYCRQLLIDYPEIATIIANELRQLWKKNEYPLGDNLWLIKTDYSLSWNNRVTPPISRLANTNAIKKLGNKSKKSLRNLFGIDDDICTPSLVKNISRSFKHTGAKLWKFGRLFTNSSERQEANLGNIIENLGNDFFREVLKFPTQDQRMILGTYNDRFPKIMTICKWATGLKTFEGRLAGSSDAPSNYVNYLVQTKKNENGETQFVKDYRGHIQADNSVAYLGAMYLPLILACDRDAIGSKGGNRGIRNGKVFIFDCGKTSFKDTLINDLQDNFEFKNKQKIFKRFKNFSLFYNTSFSERVMGLFLLYQSLSQEQRSRLFSGDEENRIACAIGTYAANNDWFAKQIKLVKEGSFTNLFDQYIEQFKCMQGQAILDGNEVAEEECATYVEHLQKLKSQATSNMEKLLLKFKNKLQLSKSEAAALDNVEKLTNKTSLLSSDRKVKLQHLVYENSSKYRWSMQKTENGALKIFTRMPVSQRQRKKILQKFGSFDGSIYYEVNKYKKHSNLELIVPPDNIEPFIAKFSNENEIINYKQNTDEKVHPSLSLFVPENKTKKIETQSIVIKNQLDDIYRTLKSIKSAKNMFSDAVANEYTIRYSLITKESIDTAIIYLMQLQHKLQILMLHNDAASKDIDSLVQCIDKLQIILRHVKTNAIDDDVSDKMMRHVNLLYKIYTRINKLYNELKKPFILRWRRGDTIKKEIKHLEQIVSVLVNNYFNTSQDLCVKLNALKPRLAKNNAINTLNHAISVIQAPYRKSMFSRYSLQAVIAKHNKSVCKLLVQQVEGDPDQQNALSEVHKVIVKNVMHTDCLIVKNYRSAQKLLKLVVERFNENPEKTFYHDDFLKSFRRDFNADHWEYIYTAIEKNKGFHLKAVLQLVKWQYQLQYFMLHNMKDTSPKIWYEVYSCIAQLKKMTDHICSYSVRPEEKIHFTQVLSLLNQIYQHVNRLYLDLKKNFFSRGFRFQQSIINEIAMLEKTAETIIYTGGISHCIDKKIIKKYNLILPHIANSGKSVSEIVLNAMQGFAGVVSVEITKLKKGLNKKYFKMWDEAHDKTAIKFLKTMILPIVSVNKTNRCPGAPESSLNVNKRLERHPQSQKVKFAFNILNKFKRGKHKERVQNADVDVQFNVVASSSGCEDKCTFMEPRNKVNFVK